MSLYPTVPVCIQLTDYELETPHLGVAPIYSVVPAAPPPYNPAVYPPSPTPFYEVEPPHCLPQYVALVGIHPMHQKINAQKQTEYNSEEEKVHRSQQKINNVQKQLENNKVEEKQKKLESRKSVEEKHKPTEIKKGIQGHQAENNKAVKEEKTNQEERESKVVTKEVILNKKDGKLGIKTAVIHKNIFIYQVKKGSGAAQAGLRLGDQIVKVNGTYVTGMSNDNVHSVIKNCPPFGIKLTIRTRRDNTLFRTLDSLKKSLNDL